MARSPEEIFAEIGGQPNSCSLEEYCAWARHLRALSSCRLLIFGVGRDSVAWQEINQGNTTLFLENNEDWIERVRTQAGDAHIRSLVYAQPYEEWAAEKFSGEAVVLPTMESPPFDGTWDCAFVDAPWGPTFGRHQSTHAATRAVRPGGLVALHDCEREREQTVCRVLLEERDFTLLEEVERLRIYQAPS